ncbi:MAG: hypothetical protein SWK76_12675 [Actinomycetota bacterium]|nr:hypothetical protein [Actinomycetota bacterium]
MYPYHKWITFQPWGCYEGFHQISAEGGNCYTHNDFGVLDMDNPWAMLYYLM